MLRSHLKCFAVAAVVCAATPVLLHDAQAQTVTGSYSPSPGTTDLTIQGTSDWVQPTGFSNDSVTLERSATGLNQIGSFAYNVGYYGGTGTPTGPTVFSWENGSPDPIGSSSKGISTGGAFGTGDGFSFTAPADTLTRTLVIFVGADNADGTLTATLSGDGTAYSSTFTGKGYQTTYQTFTLTYSALSAQTLNVKFATSGTKYGDYSGANSDLFGVALATSTVAAPEPSPAAALSVGVLGLGGLALAARKRGGPTPVA